jgi:signal-transduction protein with cAMP-binding, CBS, and nucleotidyltransferase domain
MGGGMKLVQHLLDSKGRELISVTAETSVLDAIKLMAEKTVGSLLIMRGDELKGIMTERDYARKVIIKGRSSESTEVGEIMTTDVCSASSQQTVNDCMALMDKRKIRHLPVIDDGTVVGMLSIGDLVQAIISDQQEEIQHLEQYISGP